MKRSVLIAMVLSLACTAFTGCTTNTPGLLKSAGAVTETTGIAETKSAEATDSAAAQAAEAAQPAPSPSSTDNLAGIPAYDPDAIPADRMQQGQGFVENGALFVRYIGVEKKDLGGMPGIVLEYELTNLSEEAVYSQTLYLEVYQSAKQLKNPFGFEPAYLAAPMLEPKQTLVFRDEYLLDNEADPVEAKIRQFLVLTSDPPWVVKTFPLE